MQSMTLLRRHSYACLALPLALAFRAASVEPAPPVDRAPVAHVASELAAPSLSVDDAQRATFARTCEFLLELQDAAVDRLIERLLVVQLAAEADDPVGYDAAIDAASESFAELDPMRRAAVEDFVRREQASRGSTSTAAAGCSAQCLLASCSASGTKCKCKCSLFWAICGCKK